MNLTLYEPRWTPYRRGWLSRLVGDGLFEPFPSDFGIETKEGFTPAVEISEDDEAYTINAELPGIDKKDVHIEVKDGVLTLRGERKHEHEEKEDGYFRTERSYGSFERSFALPEAADEEKIKASFNDGILTVTLPKGEVAKPKQIEVKVN